MRGRSKITVTALPPRPFFSSRQLGHDPGRDDSSRAKAVEQWITTRGHRNGRPPWRRGGIPCDLIAAAALTLSLVPSLALAQRGLDATAAEPFKLGTFEIYGTPRVGIVLQDKIIVDIVAANNALQRDRSYPVLAIPQNMRALIANTSTA